MHKILILYQYYKPGYKAGGPVQSIYNFANALKDNFEISIIAGDKDSDGAIYDKIKKNIWYVNDGINVFYIDYRKTSLNTLKQLISGIQYDLLYLNSFFTYSCTIRPLILKRFGLINIKKIVLAPRGEFSEGAISINWVKKKLYILFSKAIGLYKDVIWQASNDYERLDIEKHFSKANIIVAPNVPPLSVSIDYRKTRVKVPGLLNIIYLSRITKKKNLDTALKIVRNLKGHIKFSIYGPKEDVSYWELCEKIIKKMPHNISVYYRGEVPHDNVVQIFGDHDVFLFPTKGENFGHVILESLMAGCPVLISDQTPWKNLQSIGIGWDLPLERLDLFRTALEELIDMDILTYSKLSDNARRYGREVTENVRKVIVEQNKKLIYTVLQTFY